MLASDRLLAAALEAIYQGLVAIRNESLSQDGNLRAINSLAEALHDVPRMIQQAEYFGGGEPELLSLLRCHLASFEKARFPEFPNLLQIFEGKFTG